MAIIEISLIKEKLLKKYLNALINRSIEKAEKIVKELTDLGISNDDIDIAYLKGFKAINKIRSRRQH